MGGLLADGVPPRRSPVKRKARCHRSRPFFFLGDAYAKSAFSVTQPRSGGTTHRPPRTCAGLSMSTSEASCHRRDLSRAATRRELPGVQPPRTCAGLSMSTSEASCHRRDLSRAATRRELPGVQPPRSDSPGTGPADEKTENFTFAPFLPLPFLHPSPADRRPSAPGCGAPPRASPHTSPAAPGFSAAAAGGTSGYTP